ncbi:hypothetical protein AB1Y20_010829 [Prymnesium parvum]|uniref:Uncharacterized protein n=1 Tax=Prymnesium parvum TaxID=97485 RepID=A0AB34ISH5_PRYPA
MESAVPNERLVSFLQYVLPSNEEAVTELASAVTERARRRSAEASAPADDDVHARVKGLEDQIMKLLRELEMQRASIPSWVEQRVDEQGARSLADVLAHYSVEQGGAAAVGETLQAGSLQRLASKGVGVAAGVSTLSAHLKHAVGDALEFETQLHALDSAPGIDALICEAPSQSDARAGKENGGVLQIMQKRLKTGGSCNATAAIVGGKDLHR